MSSQYSMTTRQPREIPPARRQAHTSSLSSRHSVGNSCHVVAAGTTAVGRASTPFTLTWWLICPPSSALDGAGTGRPYGYGGEYSKIIEHMPKIDRCPGAYAG